VLQLIGDKEMIPFTKKDVKSMSALLGISEEEVLQNSKDKKLRADMMFKAGQRISDVIFGSDEVMETIRIKDPKV